MLQRTFTLLLGASLAMGAGIGGAQDDIRQKQPNQTPPQAAQPAQPQAAAPAAQDREAKSASVHRAEDIIGAEVKNEQDQDLGDIKDLVVELNTGKVRYAAVSFGGLFGIGDKLFAMPMQAVEARQDEDGDLFFAANVSKEKLENAPGFEEDKWPEMAGAFWGREVDRFYRPQQDPQAAPQRQSPATQQEGSVSLTTIYRVSKIKDIPVKNEAGEDLGDIEDLVIDLNNHQVRYAALKFGDTLGFGGKLFAIPWKSMTLKVEEEDRHFVLNIDPQKLEESEGFDDDNWPNVADPEWSKSIDDRYPQQPERTGAARPEQPRRIDTPEQP